MVAMLGIEDEKEIDHGHFHVHAHAHSCGAVHAYKVVLVRGDTKEWKCYDQCVHARCIHIHHAVLRSYLYLCLYRSLYRMLYRSLSHMLSFLIQLRCCLRPRRKEEPPK